LYSKNWLNNCSILECVYTTIRHHLSFKRTIKNKQYHLLFEKELMDENDMMEIKNSERKIFRFEKGEVINGVLKAYIKNSEIISGINNKYLESKYKDAFYLKKDILSSKYNFLSDILFNTYGDTTANDKILKYSHDLYDKINKYLNNDNQKENEIIDKTINAMDEMFMIAPLSEDGMILYRGFKDKGMKIDPINYGIQKGYISTTSNEYLGYYYSIIDKTKYLKLLPRLMIAPLTSSARYHYLIKIGTKAGIALGVAIITSLTIMVTMIIVEEILKELKEKYLIKPCCFFILHLDDGIPFIKLNNLSCYDDEVILPRGLNMENMYVDEKHEITLKKKKIMVTAYHVRLSLTEELKKSIKKMRNVWNIMYGNY